MSNNEKRSYRTISKYYELNKVYMTVETKVAKLLHIKIFPHNTVNKVWQKKPTII